MSTELLPNEPLTEIEQEQHIKDIEAWIGYAVGEIRLEVKKRCSFYHNFFVSRLTEKAVYEWGNQHSRRVSFEVGEYLRATLRRELLGIEPEESEA